MLVCEDTDQGSGWSLYLFKATTLLAWDGRARCTALIKPAGPCPHGPAPLTIINLAARKTNNSFNSPKQDLLSSPCRL